MDDNDIERWDNLSKAIEESVLTTGIDPSKLTVFYVLKAIAEKASVKAGGSTKGVLEHDVDKYREALGTVLHGAVVEWKVIPWKTSTGRKTSLHKGLNIYTNAKNGRVWSWGKLPERGHE